MYEMDLVSMRPRCLEARRGASADSFFRGSAVALTLVTGPRRRGSAAHAPHDTGFEDFGARCRWTQKALNFTESHETSAFAFVLSADIFFVLAVGLYSMYIIIAQTDLSEGIQTHHMITTRRCLDL